MFYNSCQKHMFCYHFIYNTPQNGSLLECIIHICILSSEYVYCVSVDGSVIFKSKMYCIIETYCMSILCKVSD